MVVNCVLQKYNFLLRFASMQKMLYLCGGIRNYGIMTNTRLRTLFLFVSMVIVIVSVLFTNNIANQLADEERKKIEIWADATRQFILADENTDVDFVSSIMENNTTIPVYMVDSLGRFLFSRNVKEPKQNVGKFYAERIAELRETQEPIEVRIADDVCQYIYYDESTLLRQLHYFPYVQFTIIFLFVFISLYVVHTMQRSEQNRVWVGLSKETAHQLGTPISSLLAWQELLTAKYPDDKLIPEMEKDITRLQTIADRFSKIGSEPNLERKDIVPLLQETVTYMQKRTSAKVMYSVYAVRDGGEIKPIYVMVNAPLFSWVLENLCKNAVDAMEGRGAISFAFQQDEKHLHIDISDTGKGLRSRDFQRVFDPGFTTKKRGWGLGLSLAKRIIEDYHGGKIFVLRSTVGQGTTFRITLPYYAALNIQEG